MNEIHTDYRPYRQQTKNKKHGASNVHYTKRPYNTVCYAVTDGFTMF